MNAFNTPINLGNGATARIMCSSGWVAQNPTQVAGSGGSSSLAVNGRSVGLYVQYGGFDYLVSGDLTGNEAPYVEQALRDLLIAISDSPIGDPVDVLRINHHGSNSSSAQGYLSDLKPEVAVISVGDGNSYGHPAQEVLDRLNNIYPDPLKHIYLTEEGEIGRDYHQIPHDFLYGTIVISTDGQTYSVTNSQGGVDVYSVDVQTIYVEPGGWCTGKTPCWSRIQDAVNDAASGATIKVVSGEYNEDVTVGSQIILLQGGWDSSFSVVSSTSQILSLTISGGLVSPRGIIIRRPPL
jgi:hypothetical protein